MPNAVWPFQAMSNARALLLSAAVAIIAIWTVTRSIRWALSAVILLGGMSPYLVKANSRLRIVFAISVFAVLSIASYYVTMPHP